MHFGRITRWFPRTWQFESYCLRIIVYLELGILNARSDYSLLLSRSGTERRGLEDLRQNLGSWQMNWFLLVWRPCPQFEMGWSEDGSAHGKVGRLRIAGKKRSRALCWMDMVTWRCGQAIQRERFGRQVEEIDCSWREIRVKRWRHKKEEAYHKTSSNALYFREDEPAEETEIQLAGLEVLGEGWEEWGGIWWWAHIKNSSQAAESSDCKTVRIHPSKAPLPPSGPVQPGSRQVYTFRGRSLYRQVEKERNRGGSGGSWRGSPWQTGGPPPPQKWE